MQFNKSIHYYSLLAKNSIIVKVAFVLCFGMYFSGRPWATSNMYDSLQNGFTCFSISLSILPSFFILLYFLNRKFENETVLVRLKKKTRYALKINCEVVQMAIGFAFYYVFVTFSLSAVFVKNAYDWKSAVEGYGIAGEVSPFGIFFRTGIIMSLFLILFGSLFVLLNRIINHSIAPFLILITVPCADQGMRSYYGPSFLMKFLLPDGVGFYVDNKSFLLAAIVLTLLSTACMTLFVFLIKVCDMRGWRGDANET